MAKARSSIPRRFATTFSRLSIRWVGSKAAFFARIGYGRGDSGRLTSDLLEIAKTGDATLGSGNQFGRKYEVRGTLLGGGHRAVEVITVWIVLANETTPRFVTAYPR